MPKEMKDDFSKCFHYRKGKCCINMDRVCIGCEIGLIKKERTKEMKDLIEEIIELARYYNHEKEDELINVIASKLKEAGFVHRDSLRIDEERAEQIIWDIEKESFRTGKTADSYDFARAISDRSRELIKLKEE